MNKIVEYIDKNRWNLVSVICIYISIFINSIVLFKQPFEFYIGYFIYLFLLPGFIGKYGFNRILFFIFFILLIVGIFNVFDGNNTFALFLKVYTGLLLAYVFYQYVIQELDFNIELLFKWYLKGAYIVCFIGLVQFISFQVGFRLGYDYSWLLNKWGVITGGNFGIRINSVFAEPTYFAAVVSSAFFVAFYSLIMKEGYYYNKLQSIIIVGVYFLSFSGLGQGGIFLTFLFLGISFGFIRYIIILIPVAIVLFNVLYNNVGEFKSRYDSIVGLFKGEKFVLGKTHGSSFVLYNNYVVATENFKSNYLFGTGIGSHPIAFEKYSIAKEFKMRGFSFNSADANSMLLRLISETGIFGVSIFMFIIFKFYVNKSPEDDSYYWMISNALLIMILLNLFRQGHYFLNGFPFFVMLYCYNYSAYQRHLEKQLPPEVEP